MKMPEEINQDIPTLPTPRGSIYRESHRDRFRGVLRTINIDDIEEDNGRCYLNSDEGHWEWDGENHCDTTEEVETVDSQGVTSMRIMESPSRDYGGFSPRSNSAWKTVRLNVFETSCPTCKGSGCRTTLKKSKRQQMMDKVL